MANVYRGETLLEMGGQTRTLRYSWSAILALRTEFGDGFDSALTEAMVGMDLERVATALAIGLQEDWPGVTASDIMQASPAVSPALNALSLALGRALHGPEGAPPERPENPLRAAWRRLISSAQHWLQVLRPA